jgi:hypothetical protein
MLVKQVKKRFKEVQGHIFNIPAKQGAGLFFNKITI